VGGHKHAILSASGSERWLTCTPSAQLEQQFTDEGSVFAAEGTLAHALADIMMQNHLGLIAKRKLNKELSAIMAHELYSPEMMEHIATYCTLAGERISEARARSKDAMVFLEQRLDFSPWVPEGFGTGDLVIIADDILEIIDFKYGKGVAVDATGNTQMRLYALGALNHYGMLYDIQTVRTTICQPRLDSISIDEVSAEQLYDWAENFVKPRADRAMAGEGDFVAGEHCRFCRARYTCRARAQTNLELAKHDFADPPTLTNEEIAEVLLAAEELKKWAADVQSYALEQAEKHGVKFPGWKLVEGRSNRKYSDPDAVAQRLLEAEYQEEQIYQKSLLGITAMEKLVGKKRLGELLGELVIKPAGKPTLVPESDKRPELQSVASAKADFAEAL
jgi:hypothetical protein